MEIVTGTNRDSWNSFVAEAGGSFLQSWQWGEFKRHQGWQVLRLMACEGGQPRGVMQVLMRVAPVAGAFFYAAEGPVLRPGAWSGDDTPLQALLGEARRRGALRGALTLRLDPLTSEPDAPAMLAAVGLRRSPTNVQPAATAVVDLDRSESELWGGLARDARYRVGRARKKGVTLRPGTDDDVDLFAGMLAETGSRKGFAVRGASYVRLLTRMLREQDSGVFLVAMLDDAMIGATVAATFGQRAASLYTASNDVGRTEGAQHLLHWEAILHARERGCALYDFRGVGAAGDDPFGAWGGLTFFKTRFGTRHEDLPGAWDDVYRPLAYKSFLLAQDVRRRAPGTLSMLAARLRPATTSPIVS